MKPCRLVNLLLMLPLFLLLTVTSACGDDDYRYPSVALEFLTAHTGADGSVQTIVTDDGMAYDVAADDSQSRFTADSTLRVVAYYEEVTPPMSSSKLADAHIYSLATTISSLPKPASEFTDGVHTDPAAVTSIWAGRNYLNIRLTVKAQNGRHLFGFVEEYVAPVEAGSESRAVHLSLYHDARNDVPATTQTAYLSIPLAQYAAPGINRLAITFTLNTVDGEKTYEVACPIIET
jgi:hypothetical protein